MAGGRLRPSAPKQWQNTKRLGHGRYRHANRADCDIACVVHQRTARLVTSSSWGDDAPTFMPDQVSGFFSLHKRHLRRRRSIFDQPTQLGLVHLVSHIRRSEDMLFGRVFRAS